MDMGLSTSAYLFACKVVLYNSVFKPIWTKVLQIIAGTHIRRKRENLIKG